MVLLAKRVRASTVASISTSVSSASLHLMMRSAMCSSSAAVKRAPLGWFEDWAAVARRGCMVADFFLAFAIFSIHENKVKGAHLKVAATNSMQHQEHRQDCPPAAGRPMVRAGL